MAAWHIIKDHMLLGHDAERYDPNTTMTASKQAGEPDLICFNDIIEAHVKIMSIFIKINFYIIYKREGAAPGGLALLLVAMSFGRHFGQPMLGAVLIKIQEKIFLQNVTLKYGSCRFVHAE